jgi:hypothetical protein
MPVKRQTGIEILVHPRVHRDDGRDGRDLHNQPDRAKAQSHRRGRENWEVDLSCYYLSNQKPNADSMMVFGDVMCTSE